MPTQRLTQVPAYLFSFLLFSGLAFANSGTFTINLSSTPTPINCSDTDRYVSSFTVNAAGGSQKAYIGLADLNTVTLHHVAKILFPNTVVDSQGNPHYTQSESYTESATWDIFDLCSIYVAAEGTYGAVTVNFADNLSSYDPPLDDQLVLAGAGPVSGSCESPDQCQTQPEMLGVNGSGFYQRAEFSVIPGDGEKVQVGYRQGADFAHELFPNSGDTTRDGAHSEGFGLDDPGYANSVSVKDLIVHPEQGGAVLFSGWTLYSRGQFATTTYSDYSTVSKTIIVSTSSQQVIAPDTLIYTTGVTTNNVTRFTVSMVPGACSKVDIYYDGTFVRTLVPNCGGGWSDSFSYDNMLAIDGTKFSLQAQGSPAPVMVTIIAGGPSLPVQLKSALVTWPSAHQMIPIPLGMVTSLSASTIAGGAGKVYVGTCDMNPATGFHVVAILFPANTVYEKEEQFSVADPRYFDSIDSSSLCVTGDVDAEAVSVWAHTSGFNGMSGTGSMVLTAYGAVASANGSLPTPFMATSTPVAVFRSQAIPGQYGATVYGTAGMAGIQQPDPSQIGYYKTLLANQGDSKASDAHSEIFQLSCTQLDTTNCIDLSQVYFWQQYGGQALISAWVIAE